MNELLWLTEQVGRYTYRPGTKLSVEGAPGLGGYSIYTLRVEYWALDSYHPEGPPRTFKARFVIPEFWYIDRDPERFAHWMSETMIEVEVHESREWLRRDGQLVRDPHSRAAAA